MKIKFAVGVLVATAMLLAGVFSSTALADYPPPNGSVEFEVASTAAGTGEAVVVTVIVLDADGTPVASAACAMSITGQPGSGASVAQDSPETDANGVITGTLYVGGSVGNVVVTAVCPAGTDASDVLSASGTVVVTGTGGPALPPASLPDTGAGLADSDGGAAYAQAAIAFGALGGALLMFGMASLAARQRGRRN